MAKILKHINLLVIAILLTTSIILAKYAYAQEDLLKCSYAFPKNNMFGSFKYEMTSQFLSNLPNYTDEILYFSIISRWPNHEICVVIYSTTKNSYELMSIEAKEKLWDVFYDNNYSLKKELSFEIHKKDISQELSISLNKIVIAALSKIQFTQPVFDEQITENKEVILDGNIYTVEIPKKNLCGAVVNASSKMKNKLSWINLADRLYRYSTFSNSNNEIEKEQLLKEVKKMVLKHE